MHLPKVPMMTNGFLSIHRDPPPKVASPVLTTDRTTANSQTTKNTPALTQDTRHRQHHVPKSASSAAKDFRNPSFLELAYRAASTHSSAQIPKAGVQAGTQAQA